MFRRIGGAVGCCWLAGGWFSLIEDTLMYTIGLESDLTRSHETGRLSSTVGGDVARIISVHVSRVDLSRILADLHIVSCLPHAFHSPMPILYLPNPAVGVMSTLPAAFQRENPPATDQPGPLGRAEGHPKARPVKRSRLRIFAARGSVGKEGPPARVVNTRSGVMRRFHRTGREKLETLE